MPSIQVTGILEDPSSGVESDAELRIISKINYGKTTKNADALVVLSSAGEYDFQLVHGKHLFAVKSKGAQAFTNIGTVVVGEGSPSPIDIITLIATSNEEPDPILITQLQLIAAEAAASAAEAAQSELNAANSANAAAQSEANAAQSESNANDSALSASTSETNAANSASSAQTSATNAAQSETNAANSATAAAQSETNAANSALSANDSAAAAQTSANNAAQSELNAANSASAAALSETNAAQSAASASDDADRAEAAALTASSGVIDRGSWDASAGNFPTPTLTPEERTDWYRISVAGLMSDGVQPDVEVKVSDNLYWDRQNDVWYKIDNTDKVNSVNGKEGDVVLVADDIDDVYSKTEVLQITDPLGTRVTDLENTVDSHDLSLDNHETRITDVETLASNNQTALGTKADADTVIVKSNGATGGIDVPRWTTATRPDTTGTDKAIFGFNTDTDEYEAYNPETNEWGAVGGGGVGKVEIVTSDTVIERRKTYGADLSAVLVSETGYLTFTLDTALAENDYFTILDAGNDVAGTSFARDLRGFILDITASGMSFDVDATDKVGIFDSRKSAYTFQVVNGLITVRESSYGQPNDYWKSQIAVKEQRLHIAHRTASETVSGNANVGVNVRNMNTVVENTIEGAQHDVLTYKTTLPAGVYEVHGYAAAFQVARHRAFLRDAVTLDDILVGSPEYSNAASPTATNSVLMGRITLDSQTLIETAHYISTSKSANGLGVEVNDGRQNDFAVVIFTRIK